MEEKNNLQKYLSDNNSNLYEYLKKEIANAIKVDDLKNGKTLFVFFSIHLRSVSDIIINFVGSK